MPYEQILIIIIGIGLVLWLLLAMLMVYYIATKIFGKDKKKGKEAETKCQKLDMRE